MKNKTYSIKKGAIHHKKVNLTFYGQSMIKK